MKTKQYIIRPIFARSNGIPASFVAATIHETEKAIFVHGHGKMDPEGSCAKCGKPLTHPGSILIGIGPVCLGDWGRRDVVLDNITEEQKKSLQVFIQEQQISQWIPKSWWLDRIWSCILLSQHKRLLRFGQCLQQ